VNQPTRNPALERLTPLVGEWALGSSFSTEVQGRVVFEWILGGQFLMERSEVPHPFPDGVAIIGADAGGETYTQHYFDSRGVARVYAMTFDEGVWKLWRDAPDFTPLDFSQRFTGTFSDDGKTIESAWEICHDGSTWEHDFDLTYTKVG
jgi:hypothetical protein